MRIYCSMHIFSLLKRLGIPSCINHLDDFKDFSDVLLFGEAQNERTLTPYSCFHSGNLRLTTKGGSELGVESEGWKFRVFLGG